MDGQTIFFYVVGFIVAAVIGGGVASSLLERQPRGRVLPWTIGAVVVMGLAIGWCLNVEIAVYHATSGR